MGAHDYSSTAITKRGTEIELWLEDRSIGHRFAYNILVSVDGGETVRLGKVTEWFGIEKVDERGCHDTAFEYSVNDRPLYLDEAIEICEKDNGDTVTIAAGAAGYHFMGDNALYHVEGSIVTSDCTFDGDVHGTHICASRGAENGFIDFHGVERYYVTWLMGEFDKAGA